MPWESTRKLVNVAEEAFFNIKITRTFFCTMHVLRGT